MKLRVYIATSVDGFVATPDGGVDWLASYPGDGYGYQEFIAGIGAIVFGRATFDQVLGMGDWPYAAQDVHVLTSRPIVHAPPRTTAWGEAEALVRHLRASALDRDVWVAGGPRSIEALRGLDAVDAWELYVIPLLLGDGIPLFSRVREPSQRPLHLVDAHAFPDGVVRLVWERA